MHGPLHLAHAPFLQTTLSPVLSSFIHYFLFLTCNTQSPPPLPPPPPPPPHPPTSLSHTIKHNACSFCFPLCLTSSLSSYSCLSSPPPPTLSLFLLLPPPPPTLSLSLSCPSLPFTPLPITKFHFFPHLENLTNVISKIDLQNTDYRS